jgi:MFS family permease
MQRTAQDWLVLTQLTDHNATAVGIVMALQFGPSLFLLPLTGAAADHCDRRKLLIATQTALGLLALGLGLLTVLNVVRLWHVYVFALLLGCVTAFDAPARQTFVSDLVGEDDLSNAVALNSTTFNSARLVGPALAGVLIASISSGWVFLLNAASFAAVIGSLIRLQLDEMQVNQRPLRKPGNLLEGFRYVWERPDLKAILLMIALIGTFALNFPIFISTMAVGVFRSGAEGYGALTSTMAVGSILGTLVAASRAKPSIALLFAGSASLGLSYALAALSPTPTVFGLTLVLIGLSAQAFTSSANSMIQLLTQPEMRGRVMAIFLAVAMGGTPIGAPIAGWVADSFGPRWALAIAAATSLLASLVGIAYLITYRHLRLRWVGGRPEVSCQNQ